MTYTRMICLSLTTVTHLCDGCDPPTSGKSHQTKQHGSSRPVILARPGARAKPLSSHSGPRQGGGGVCGKQGLSSCEADLSSEVAIRSERLLSSHWANA
jgi:hypothetical protein